jgi:hypothetical protein
MLTMEQIYRIRNMRNFEGKSLMQIFVRSYKRIQKDFFRWSIPQEKLRQTLERRALLKMELHMTDII